MRDKVLQDVRDAVKNYLWPLSPGGYDGNGWTLGQSVVNKELEVVVARVKGVRSVTGVNLFSKTLSNWSLLPTNTTTDVQRLELQAWQLPELLSIVVVDDEDTVPAELKSGAGTTGDVIPIPVIPELC